MDGDELTQATQHILDPRRVGKQNSGFSDEDISDIVCVLYPHSAAARQEVQRLAHEGSPHIIGRDEADVVEPDYELEDHASRFNSNLVSHGDYAIVLRLSAQIKNPAAGFAFGRNRVRCDIVFVNDPLRRVSNVHFRIYVNEYGNVMIEDQSTNGTHVDTQLLTCHPKPNSTNIVTKWVLSSGSIIRAPLHKEKSDLTFRVRIPRRDDDYDRAYINKVEEYFTRHGLKAIPDAIAPLTGGHVDLFKKAPGDPVAWRKDPESTSEVLRPPHPKRRETQHVMRREWTGSDKYKKIGKIGRGAFAVVYKVTSKYDGRPYAAKELEKRRFVKNGVLDHKVENEMKIMRRVQHPYIVRYMENIEWDDRLLIIIMEFVPGGDLGKFILDDGALPEDMTQTMAKQLLSALGYLHANNITHRDVKPDNILINTIEPFEVKLTDFGLSKIVDTEQTFLTTFCGTLLYCAPEVHTEYPEYDDNGVRNWGKKMRCVPGQRYSHAVDIWSLGGVLFYTLNGSPPYPVTSGTTPTALLHKIMTTMLNISPLQRYRVSELGIDFLHRMLQRRPENRATIPELESHAWLGGEVSIIQASQSYDEITDDEDVIVESSQFWPAGYGDDCISDSMDEGSEKDHSNVAEGAPPPRLFGEVGVSAIGSSGVIPAGYLNLPVDTSMGGPDIPHEGGANDSGDSNTMRGWNRQAHHHNTTSIYSNQSADQLQSLVDDVASPSLGGKESLINDLGMSSQHLPQFVDPNSSKRKPPPYGTSDEIDGNVSVGKSTIKRLKSEGDVDEVAEDVVLEFKLLACIPQVKRLGSGRQIDSPVSKLTFWEQDRQTWHLWYPKMTQLQYDAFLQAARKRDEEFGPGKTPLWDLAMKYFPPSPGPWAQKESLPSSTGRLGLKRGDYRIADDTMDIPSTAAPIGAVPLRPMQQPDTQIVVPVRADPASNRATAMFESHPESCIQGISFPVTDSLASFGRGYENTEIFEDSQESRVPKYAFKVMLWKEGYNPSKDPSKMTHPWQKASSDEDESYHFWISTKATLGIRINGFNLASSDTKNPSGPSRYWARISDGDCVAVWGGQEPRNQTKLIFHCFWGGSSRPRPEDGQKLELASSAVAEKLDAACQRTEKRIREAAERQRRFDEANAEHQERLVRVEMERERSHMFEKRRQEAVEYLAATQQHGSRRGSPGIGVFSTAQASRMQAAIQASRLGPDRATARSVR